MVRTLQTCQYYNVQRRDCFGRSMLQTLNLATVSVPHSKRSLLCQDWTTSYAYYVYADSNDIHNLVTIVLLSQQVFKVLFFLVKFKTMGLMDEPDLAAILCAKALSSKWWKLFSKSCRYKVIRPGTWHKVIFSPSKVLISTLFTKRES